MYGDAGVVYGDAGVVDGDAGVVYGDAGVVYGDAGAVYRDAGDCGWLQQLQQPAGKQAAASKSEIPRRFMRHSFASQGP